MTAPQQQAASIRRTLDRLLEWTVIILVMGLVVDVLWGVVTRFLLNSPSRWTEEVARLLLMWVALLGAAVAFGRREHLGLDLFVIQLDPAARRLMAAASEAVVIAFALLVMVYGGGVLVQETLVANQLTPALEMKMGYAYLALPVSGSFIVYYSVDHLFRIARSNRTSSDAVDRPSDPAAPS